MRRPVVLALPRVLAALVWLGAAFVWPACTSTDMSVVALPDAGLPPDVSGPSRDATTLDGSPDVPPGSCRVNGDCVAPDLCTNARRCVDGRCVAVGGAPDCGDGIACTVDRCDAAAGRCAHDPRDSLCPSGRFCDPEQGCIEPPSCEAGDTSCARLNHDTCNGTWSCNHVRGLCERSAPVRCDDGDRCTTDTCVSGMNAHRCEHAPIERDCGPRRCGMSPSGCFTCGSCVEGECNEQGECVTCPECQRRSNGMCVDASPEQTCTDDGDRCTQDLCRGGTCAHPPLARDCGSRVCGPSPSGCVASCGECPAGQFCGADGQCSRCPACQGWNGAACVALAEGSICLDDGNRCTLDVCRSGTCTHPPLANDCVGRVCGASPSGCVASCGMCNGICGADGTCTPCPACQYASGGRCVAASDGVACTDDGNACTIDACQGGQCTHAQTTVNDCGGRGCGMSPSGCHNCGTCTDGRCVDGACVLCPECQRWNGAACVPDVASRACTDDGNRCTQDVCGGGACTHPPLANDCGGRVCGMSPSGCFTCGAGTCARGTCVNGACVECGECQTLRAGVCAPAADGGACTDDGNRCTQDVCGGGACTHPPLANDCGSRTCGMSPSGCHTCGTLTCPNGPCVESCRLCPDCQRWNGSACVALGDGTACTDDGDRCTRDVCGTGTCTHPPIANDCGTRTCGAASSGCFQCGTCASGPCSNGACVACPECQRWNGAACVSSPDGETCTSDGSACTQDVCRAGACTHPAVTNDCGGRACGMSPSGCFTCGTCASGQCVNGACVACPECQRWNGAACVALGDGTACTDDGNRCTVDACASGTCRHAPVNATQDCSGRACGPSATGCTSSCGTCTSGPCAGGVCGTCPACQQWNGVACAPSPDGTACTDDGDRCTQDACNLGRCLHPQTPNDCGGRNCGPSPSGCHSCGSSDCNDRDSCTVDYCDGSGRCNNLSLNDCGGRQCGPSPSGCRNCGTCPSGSACNNGRCESPCGNGSCDPGESCSSCPQDCSRSEIANYLDDNCNGRIDEGIRTRLARLYYSSGARCTLAGTDWDHCFSTGSSGSYCYGAGQGGGSGWVDDGTAPLYVYPLSLGGGSSTITLRDSGVGLARLDSCYEPGTRQHRYVTFDFRNYPWSWSCSPVGYVKTGAPLSQGDNTTYYEHYLASVTDYFYSTNPNEGWDWSSCGLTHAPAWFAWTY